MLFPQECPADYDSYIEYLCDYTEGLLSTKPYVPFWMRAYLDNLDLIEAEPDADLERMKAFILEEPTYERLYSLYGTLRQQMVAVRGPNVHNDGTPLGRKYRVILNLLVGLHEKPFYEGNWEVSFSCYALKAFDLDDTKKAILENHVKVTLAQFEPDDPENPS